MSSAVAPSRRPFIVASMMLATFMVAIEATIIATAMPQIVGQLGGFEHYSWVFSGFLLAQSTTTVIYGKLADIFGRKPVMIAGILLFLVGSVLCGLAWSMLSLVVFRVVQGLGAGAIQPLTITLVGDLYPFEQRGRAQGLMASVWATSAVSGPLAGGLIVDHLSWAWIFWINLPFGVFTILGFALFLHETVERKRPRIDYAGAALFTLATVSLLLILTEGGAGAAFLLAFAAVFAVSLALFLAQERRAPEPLISIALWARPLIATCNASTLMAGMALLGLTTVLPIYLQCVLGRSPLVAGFALTMLVIGWPLAVLLSRKFYRAIGVRSTLRLGSVVFPLGAAVLPFLTPDSSVAVAGAASFLMGFGMGLISLTSIVLVQDSVEWSMRGSATASLIFARSLGNTLGAAALGAVLNAGIAHHGGDELAVQVHALMNRPDGLAELAASPAVRAVLDSALHWSFLAVVAMAVLTLAATWVIPVSAGPARRPAEGGR